jgi:xanthine dehydrogenase YagS FAD-binding subunit
MRPFSFEAVRSAGGAVAAAARIRADVSDPTRAQYLAGGTTLIDLMKLDVMRPAHVVDINALHDSELGRIDFGAKGLRLGALVRMAEAAEHAEVVRNYPAIAQSLQLAASQQVRNMASLGGNVLQRTRCPYFRDVSYEQCNKRNPGSGCAALDGFNRSHAVLGTSDQCIASYPGDFAQALIALDATAEIAGPRGKRSISFAALHRKPANAPNIETSLAHGEMLTAFVVPTAAWTRRSVFIKIRDRESYEFALASAVVALDLEGGQDLEGGHVRDARIALGGVATVPWRANAAEAALKGKALDDASQRAAAEAAFSGAQTHEHNTFKVRLGKETLIRALKQAGAMEI